MSLTSVYFLIFCIIFVPVYYLVPKKIQWCVLLAASLVFYAFGDLTNIFYVLFVSGLAYISTLLIAQCTKKQKTYLADNKNLLSRDEKKAYKESVKKQKKKYMLAAVLGNIVLLLFFKLLPIANSVFSIKSINFADIIIPLGLSYYTLQTMGYIIDVYWGNVEAESNYLKLLLFVSFFPQVTQGPISDFKQLSSELFSEHNFLYENYSRGFQRLVWGFFKKLIIANKAIGYVLFLYESYDSLSGLTLLLGAFLAMLQLYADFSGYMDIVCGLCEILDIKLPENFNRPFISKSLSEFWRRWHITLGIWFKKYVFFTVGTSRFSKRLLNGIKEKGGNTVAENAVSTVALVSIWFLIGVWHGINLPYILWGLITGAIMIASVWLTPFYSKIKKLLSINDNSKPLAVFGIIKTFILVSILEVFSDAGSLADGTGYIIKMISSFWVFPKSLNELFPYVGAINDFYMVSFGLAAVIAVDLIGIKKDIRTCFSKVPAVIRSILLACAVFVILVVGIQEVISIEGGFMYANF